MIEQETIQKIPTHLIDSPLQPMRSQMDQDGLISLGQSIRDHGQIQPIVVRVVMRCSVCHEFEAVHDPTDHSYQEQKRYEVIAGHRRLLACKMADIATLDCIVRDVSSQDLEVVKMHENLMREDVNPVDQAFYVRNTIAALKLSKSDFAQMTNHSPEWVQSRLDLCEYDEPIRIAIQDGRMSLGAAKWLMMIEDPKVRLMYTDYAVRGGLSVSMANAWYRSWLANKTPMSYNEAANISDYEPSQKSEFKVECPACGCYELPENMQLVYIHGECERALKSATPPPTTPDLYTDNAAVRQA